MVLSAYTGAWPHPPRQPSSPKQLLCLCERPWFQHRHGTCPMPAADSVKDVTRVPQLCLCPTHSWTLSRVHEQPTQRTPRTVTTPLSPLSALAATNIWSCLPCTVKTWSTFRPSSCHPSPSVANTTARRPRVHLRAPVESPSTRSTLHQTRARKASTQTSIWRRQPLRRWPMRITCGGQP